MNLAAQRRVSVIALTAGITLLSGCSLIPPPSSDTTQTTEADAPAKKSIRGNAPTTTDETVAEGERRGPEDLSFESGVSIDPADWRVQWIPLNVEDGFAVLQEDDGNGHWSHVDDATECEISFYQGLVTDLAAGQDDRTLTDDLLWATTSGSVEGMTREDVTEYAFDDEIPRFVDAGTIPVRTIWGGADDGSSWLNSARIFGSQGGGVHISIYCPANPDASEEFSRLIDDYLFIDVGPTSGEGAILPRQ